ncbi:hypothetical protein M8J75_004578 [Diaphorina citri]|nr:hypothetical protein M8J75_004578 [Diaphorina citri]
MGAQIKALSFLAYIVGVYHDVLSKHAQTLVDGILNLFILCPSEITKLRKELLIATRQILQADFKDKFVPRMKILLDESVILGSGWTTQDALRPLVYSTLAELIRPVIPMLPLLELSMAVHLFSRNIHDETLPTAIQTMSCKFLLNMVDAIRAKHQSEEATRSGENVSEDLLLRMLETMVLKLKTVAKLQLPVLRKKAKEQQSQSSNETTTGTEDNKPVVSNVSVHSIFDSPSKTNEKQKSKFGSPPPSALYNMSDCKNIVKVLVLSIERITMGLASIRPSPGNKFQPHDTRVYIRLVKWGMRALDIYAISSSLFCAPNTPLQQGIRTKEEKDVLDQFAGIFLLLAPQSFREIFCNKIDYMVDRVSNNYNLQVIGNVFVSKDTSPIFATLLVEYLLGHMHEMGEINTERSDLYLKLFKIVFESVSRFAENEHMLRPHVHSIVNKSMDLAMTAKKPFNYFLLLKILFLSIGNGKHDLLYQEFLPLLRNLFQGLNNLQSGLHKQQMKDLFVELCLNVPVRLSSLLPYLPMLMDPLVSALNGSPALISQGLRTLELFVGNLQPDFLYDHIQPVRADLMQALWRSLRNPNDQVALVAFRVLGKFGGGNRKMIEPQKLEFNPGKKNGPAILVKFPDHQKSLKVVLEKVMETAVNTLKSSSVDIFYRKQAWELIKDYIVSSMNLNENLDVAMKTISQLRFNESSDIGGLFHKFPNSHLRNVHQSALMGMFLAYGIKDIRKDVLGFCVVVVRQYTIIAIAQQSSKDDTLENTMDPLVMIDALTFIFAHEDKEYCKLGYLMLRCILDTATNMCGSKDIAYSLPFIEYLGEQMCTLCYEKAWYTKLGGCYAIQFLYKSLSLVWLLNHMHAIVKAFLFVFMDLIGDVSSGTLDEVKQSLQDILLMCAGPVEPNMLSLQSKTLLQVGEELVRNLATSNTLLRDQSIILLQKLADIQGKSIVEVMEPHRDIVNLTIPPKKLNITDYSANAQIGLMEANTFCQSLTPRFFTMDINDTDHKTFFQHVYNICESSDQALIKMPCYKSVDTLIPLRKAAMRALASWHYIPGVSQKIFNVLYAALDKPNPELQTAAFQAMKTFVNGSPIELKTMYDVTKPFLLTLTDYRNFDLKGVKKLSYIVQSFPSIFYEKLCEQLLVNLKNLFQDIASLKNTGGREDTEKIIVIIMEIFEESPAAKPQFIDSLIGLVLQHEKALDLGHSPYRVPLVKYLLRYPTETLQSLLNETHMKDAAWRLFLVFLIKHPDGKSFRECLQTQFTGTLTAYTSSVLNINCHTLTQPEKLEMQYIGIRLVSILIKLDDQWLSSQTQLVSVVQKIWRDSKYLERHTKVENINCVHWKEPKLLVKILLHYFSHHPNIIDLLFFILKAVTEKLLPDFTFLREFLDVTVAQSYTVEWKRNAFTRFVELFKTTSVSQELKAKILQLILIPCFTVCFERGEGDKLIAGKEGQGQKNLATLFISQIVETSKPCNLADNLRILVLQMSCLLVDQAYHHIYDVSQGKASNNVVKPLIIFAWPSLLTKNCVDPATQYYGHLLLSHMIAKFAVSSSSVQVFSSSKRIVVQVFISLLKAHASEVSSVVRQALEILTPAFPECVDNGYRMLAFWTKKIIIEEGHSLSQLFHLLTLIVKHYKVYYPVRHGLIQHMVAAMQRMRVSSSIDQKKLSVELADVIIKWELQRIKNEADTTFEEPAYKKMAMTSLNSSGEPSSQPIQDDLSITAAKPIEKTHVDSVINFLCRLACPTIELPPNLSNSIHNQVLQSLGEGLSKRCVSLVKVCLNSELWPRQNIDLQISWLDQLLSSVDDANVNLNNIATAFELLIFFISVLDNAQILLVIKPLQKGLFTCLKSKSPIVVNHTRNFLSSLLGKFPIEYTPEVSLGREEVDILYAYLSQMIIDSLSNYEKSPSSNCSLLYGPIMFLKVACCDYAKYIDRFLDLLIRVLNRMAQEHTKTLSESASGQHDGELLSIGLNLVKNRLGSLSKDSRSLLLDRTLAELIDKTSDMNVMKSILDMTDNWVRGKDTELENAPNLAEKGLILVRLMHHVNRFPDLNSQFLELTLFIYTDPRLKNSRLVSKLKPAFLSGLLSTTPELRSKFFQILNQSIRKFLYDRLMYIFNSQNWEPMGCSSWLRQCIELILGSAIPHSGIILAETSGILPSISMNPVTSPVQTTTNAKNTVDVAFEKLIEKFEEINSNEKAEVSEFLHLESELLDCESLLTRQFRFLNKAKQHKTGDFLKCISHLCHLDSSLAEHVWLDMFPQLWSILKQYQQQTLASTILPFTVSGIHVNQKQEHPCPMSTVYEALILCSPSLPIKPAIMTHLAKAHSLWHRVTISFESLTTEAFTKLSDKESHDNTLSPDEQELIDELAEMYCSLKEEDLWVGLWQKNARHKETREALAYEQQGLFEQALKTYEKAIIKGREEYYIDSTTPLNHDSETMLWEQQLTRCSKELNQWKMLRDYGKSTSSVNPFLILDTAWKVPPNEWKLMRTTLDQVDSDCPKELQYPCITDIWPYVTQASCLDRSKPFLVQNT